MSKKSAISPEMVGGYFRDGYTVYKLIDCQSEPQATFLNVGTSSHLTNPISQFSDFVHLTPDRPIEKKVEKKPRSDKGKSHNKPSTSSQTQKGKPTHETPTSTSTPPDVIIITPIDGETDYVVRIKDIETTGPSLRLAVLGTLEEWGGMYSPGTEECDWCPDEEICSSSYANIARQDFPKV